MNELEERRVIRLVNGAAEAVEPLSACEVDELLERATRGRTARRRRVPLRGFLAGAAAAAVILGTTLAASVPGPQRPSSGAAAAQAQLAEFPEGSALHLLLAGGAS